MSIPKEPRQLMINLMYLVLTAMLALNVSAEIILAFFALDRSNQHTSQTIGKELDEKVKGVKKLLEDPSKVAYQEPINSAVDKIRTLSKTFNSYVEDLRKQLIDQGGNKNGQEDDLDYYTDHGHKYPLGKKNKDITTNYLLTEGNGKKLEDEIKRVRAEMITTYNQLVDKYGETPFGLTKDEIANKKAAMEANLTLAVEEVHGDDGNTDWSTVKFRQMPLAAVLPMLSGIQNNATTSEASLVGEILSYAGGRVVEFDAFFPVINAKKAYLIKGETFEAEVSIGSYSSSLNPSDVKITVGGSSVSLDKSGKGIYKSTPSSVGKQNLKLTCAVTNPLTKKVITGEASYEYEVGMRSVTVSADKMNVFYIGVDNPLSVSAAGVSSNDLVVKGEGVELSGSKGKYIVRASKPGAAKIICSGGGLPSTPTEFRVKRIPDPVVRLGGTKTDGIVKSGEMQAQRGLLAMLDNFDFEARCDVQSYTMYYTRARQDPTEVKGNGASFSGPALAAIQAAKPGDQYTFIDVKAKCPGDVAGRQVNGLAFQIK